MTGKWRNLLRLAGFVLIFAGAFSGLPWFWPWILVVLGLGFIVVSGGFG